MGKYLLGVSILAMILMIIGGISVSYNYKKDIGTYWDLADKSSTIEAKSDYIDKFVNAFDGEKLEGRHNAVFFKTPSNSFDSNFSALKTLQSRLHEIKDMDVKSFEYQQAIQQITAQEQGEANEMLMEIRGSWMLVNHPMFWALWGILIWLSLITLLIVGIIKVESDIWN